MRRQLHKSACSPLCLNVLGCPPARSDFLAREHKHGNSAGQLSGSGANKAAACSLGGPLPGNVRELRQGFLERPGDLQVQCVNESWALRQAVAFANTSGFVFRKTSELKFHWGARRRGQAKQSSSSSVWPIDAQSHIYAWVVVRDCWPRPAAWIVGNRLYRVNVSDGKPVITPRLTSQSSALATSSAWAL